MNNVKPYFAMISEEDTNEITLNEYQKMALETAIYPQPIIYPSLGMC